MRRPNEWVLGHGAMRSVPHHDQGRRTGLNLVAANHAVILQKAVGAQ